MEFWITLKLPRDLLTSLIIKNPFEALNLYFISFCVLFTYLKTCEKEVKHKKLSYKQFPIGKFCVKWIEVFRENDTDLFGNIFGKANSMEGKSKV